MTEHEWLACTDPLAMLLFRPANQAQLDRLVDAALNRDDKPFFVAAAERILRSVLANPDLAGGAVENPSLAGTVRCLIPFRPVAPDPSWLTPDVVGLASAIYETRAFHNLPVLADALEEAGCSNAGVLEHCRGGGEHVRGCFVIDMLTGRS